MRLGAAIGYAFWHGIGLVPDDVLAQIPPIILQCECHTPRDAHEVFGAKGVIGTDSGRRKSFLPGKLLHLLARITGLARSAAVAVAKIEPKYTIIGQDFAHQRKHRYHRFHVLGQRLFSAYFRRHKVQAQISGQITFADHGMRIDANALQERRNV